VKAATDSYFADQDVIGQWLDDCCQTSAKTAITPTANLFVSWNDYATRAGEYVGNRKEFSTELSRRGFELLKHGKANVRSIRGITIGKTPLAKGILSLVPNELDETKKD
jgi:putative DNA primase/helicase